MAAALAVSDWDLIISDYSMPQFNGPQALELFKTQGMDIPFILISGTIGMNILRRKKIRTSLRWKARCTSLQTTVSAC